jgi:hypothetical protein
MCNSRDVDGRGSKRTQVAHPDMVRFEQSRRLYYIILYSSFNSYSKSVKGPC